MLENTMKKNSRSNIVKMIAIVSALVFVVASFAGCAQTQSNITIVGSTSVQPLSQDLADEYMAKNTNIKIDVQGVGSTAGVKAIHDGTCDIGTASRELKEAEKEWNLTEHVIAIDGIAVIVHTDNAVSDLTQDQIVSIFKGEIMNWSEVGGMDKEILVVSREAGSGTRGAFEEIMKLEGKKDDKTISLLKEDALIADSNGAVRTNVSTKENAIGYISLGMVDDSVKALDVDGVAATVENIKAKLYPIMRPFLMLTGSDVKPEVQKFLDYILGEGQDIVAKDYITVK